VYLYTVDDLSTLVQTAGEKRQAAVEQAEAIIDAGVQSFAHWLDQRASVPLIQALNRQAEDWREAELRGRASCWPRATVELVLDALTAGPDAEDAARRVGRTAFGRPASASRWPTPCRACSSPSGEGAGLAARRRRHLALATAGPPRPACAGVASHCLPLPMKDSLRQQLERLPDAPGELDAAWPTRPGAAPTSSAIAHLARTGRGVAPWCRCTAATSSASATSQPPRCDAGRPRVLPTWRATRSSRPRRDRRSSDAPAAALLPRDPDDARNAFLEIRAGTGGDESALFAGDLARMYLRWCDRARAGAPRSERKRGRAGRLQGAGAAHRGCRRLRR
jgi:hypothetical protein